MIDSTRFKLLLLLFFITISGYSQIPKLKLASDVWPPFTNVEEENSFAIVLVKEALNRTGIKVEIEIVGFNEVLEGIKGGEFDGSAALWKNAEREKYLLFSAPYMQNQLILVGRKGSEVSATSFSDLKGKRVAIVGTYAYGDSVDLANEVAFVKGVSDQENLEKLLKEEVDYMLVDALLLQYVLMYQEEEALKHLEIGTFPITKRSLHFAIKSDHPQAEYIIQKFNDEIVKMVAEGTYNKILHLNWIRADVDGDGNMEMVLDGKHAGANAPSSGYDVYFQNSLTSVGSSNNQYYVEGKLYEDWEKVPNQYKVAPVTNSDPSSLSLFKFSFE